MKKADVSFANGISGTEIARSVSSIILLDDNFRSVLSAVLWGRQLQESVSKFVAYQLTLNLVATIGSIVVAFSFKQELFKPIQLIWVNIVMDTAVAALFARETPSVRLLQRAPYNRDAPLLSVRILVQAIA